MVGSPRDQVGLDALEPACERGGPEGGSMGSLWMTVSVAACSRASSVVTGSA